MGCVIEGVAGWPSCVFDVEAFNCRVPLAWRLCAVGNLASGATSKEKCAPAPQFCFCQFANSLMGWLVLVHKLVLSHIEYEH